MCGIAGIYAYGARASRVSRTELSCVTEHMAVRGPDDSGIWISEDGRVGFGHRRLSIIEVSSLGAQPMSSAAGRLTIVFNGEIYNYKALRKRLEAKGHVFVSHSDTEVLLHLYAERGEAMVEDLRGMFAFGIWDRDERRLLLARDPYGIKPLYYADNGNTLRFASQVKALMIGGGISDAADAAGWTGFYLFGSVPEPFTTYAGIRAVPAGATLSITAGRVHTPRQYFSIAATYCKAEHETLRRDEDGNREWFSEALRDSVEHHLVADVPVGAFLSGGIDSGAVVGLMRDLGHDDIQTITVAFDEFRGSPADEVELAGEVAALYGTRHTMRLITEQEFCSDLPKIFAAMDQPTIDGINTWFASKAAHERGLKVALSGLGGDELFGSYPSFRKIPRLVRLFRLAEALPNAGAVFGRLIGALKGIGMQVHPKMFALLKHGSSHASAFLMLRGLFMPEDLPLLMDPTMVAEGLNALEPLDHIANVLTPQPKSDYAKVAVLESALYMRNQLLRDTDWASMAHSLEVRVPLVDIGLLRALAPSLARRGVDKRDLARAPSVPLPDAVIQRPKSGFTTPVETWIQRAPGLQQWKDVAALTAPDYPWARRWAHEVALQFETPDHAQSSPGAGRAAAVLH